MIDNTASTENPLFRAFIGTCPGWRSDDFDHWITGMSKMYRVLFGIEPSQDDLIKWVFE